MKILIRQAIDDDIDTINQIIRISKAFWGYDEEFLDKFMENFSFTPEILKKSDTKFLYVDDKLAGLYGFIMHDDTMELDNFFLLPDFIGKGLGKILWDACCQEVKKQGRNEFILWADPNAESFYLKMGCEKIGVRQSPVDPTRFPPVMRFKIMNLYS